MRLTILFFIFFVLSSCGNGDKKQPAQKEEFIKQEYLQKGAEVANQMQSELLKNVSGALKKGGPAYAIEFCNIHALSLKDSLSRLNDCQIKRISFKYRNPADMPQTEKETEQLNRYQLAYHEGKSVKPEVHIFDNRIEYYQPITIAMESCLQCHGDPEKQIKEETLIKIQSLYPNDLATGFALNDFRGAWKITFMKQQ